METLEFQDFHWLLDIIQSTDIGIVVLDKDMVIDVYNRFMQVHSNINAEKAIGAIIFDLFPYLDDEWFIRRVKSVFELGIPVYTTWEQRDNVFDFMLRFPINHEVSYMYQNATFIPLHSPRDEVEKVAIVVYDVTDVAVNRLKLEQAKEELLSLSRIDRLTGLYNRGYWEERLQSEFSRWQRSEQAVSLVMFDIDHFKSINDTYGHQLGDEAIIVVADRLRECCREVDICGRYGGEEYVVILPHTGTEGAMIFAERLRQSVAAIELSCQGKSVGFTISLGVAELSSHMPDRAAWLAAADNALYQSKQSGRNRTTCATE